MKKQIMFILVLVCTIARGQESSNALPSINQELPELSPKSPEATEFIKYGNTSVSMYTGKPEINIPIYTVEGREFNLPISLGYDAGGIQVDQIATQVGLAWSLQAGGMVTRVTNGKPDHVLGVAAKYYGSYYTEYPKLQAFFQTLISEDQIYQPVNPLYFPTLTEYLLFEHEEILQGELDTQPDSFSFKVGGISGTIYIDPETGEARCSNGKDYKISYTGSLTDFKAGGIKSWHITDEEGTQYFFEIYDTTKTFVDSSGEDNSKEFISSWQLTKIISANRKDVFDLRYTFADFWVDEKVVPATLNSVSSLVDNTNSCEGQLGTYDLNTEPYRIAQHYLSSIRLNGQEIVSFTQSATERKDLSSRYALEKISIANGIDWSFHHSYFKSSPQIDVNTANENDVRLKLDSITMGPQSAPGLQQKHRFAYHNPDAVPNLQSFSRDYWGYYNGKANTSVYGLIPKETTLVNNSLIHLPGADRTPDINHSKNGTLYRITYPTGGATTFNYEQHSLYKRKEHVSYKNTELGRLIGGNDPANPYNYWNDEFFVDSPKGAEFFVPVYQSGPKELKIRYAAPSQPHAPGDNDDGILYVALIKCDSTIIPVSPDSCDAPTGPTPITCPANLEWYDIDNYPIADRMLIKSYKGGSDPAAMVDGQTENITIDLEAGYYKLYILNGVTNSLLTVGMRYPEKKNLLTTIPVGGLRVRSTQDFTGDNTTPVLTKKYEYTHTESNECGDPITVSSGKLHYKPVFSHYANKDRKEMNHNCTDEFASCYYLRRYATPLNPKQSPHIAYSAVKEFYVDEQEGANGYTEYQFYNTLEEDNGWLSTPFFKKNFKNGKITAMSIFDKSKTLKQKTVNTYKQLQVDNAIHGFKEMLGRFTNDSKIVVETINGEQRYKLIRPTPRTAPSCQMVYQFSDNVTFIMDPPYNSTHKFMYSLANNYAYLDKTVTTDYFENDVTSSTTNYFYDGLAQFPKTNRQLTRMSITDSNGDTVETHIYYPTDVLSVTSLGNTPLTTAEFNAIDGLKKVKSDGTEGLHHATTPVQVTTTVKNASGTILSENIQRATYKTWSNGLTLSKEVQTAKKDTTLENRIQYHKYDNSGNPLEVSQADGMHSIYIWGYKNVHPIAKIDNMSYTNMPLEVLNQINAIRIASDTENSPVDEIALRLMFVDLRNHDYFKNAQVSSYIYDPLIGVTSMTDLRGYTTFYKYDALNRLETVRDADGNLLTENQYHYNNQN